MKVSINPLQSSPVDQYPPPSNGQSWNPWKAAKSQWLVGAKISDDYGSKAQRSYIIGFECIYVDITCNAYIYIHIYIYAHSMNHKPLRIIGCHHISPVQTIQFSSTMLHDTATSQMTLLLCIPVVQCVTIDGETTCPFKLSTYPPLHELSSMRKTHHL